MQTNWTKQKPAVKITAGFFLGLFVGNFRQVKLLNKIRKKTSQKMNFVVL